MIVPWLITTTRSATCSMSATSCEVRNTVVPLLLVQAHHHLAEALLGEQVEADRRLVEEQHLRAVQHRRSQLAAHPLPERERAHRHVEQVAGVQQLRELAGAPAGVAASSLYMRASRRSVWRVVSSNQSCERWPKSVPMRRASSRRSFHGTQPEHGRAAARRVQDPVSILIDVDLPAPFGPM